MVVDDSISITNSAGRASAGVYVISQVFNSSNTGITSLQRPGGSATIVLADLWLETLAEKSLTLVHELLHVYFNIAGHDLLARRLGINVIGQASDSIDKWLRNGCK